MVQSMSFSRLAFFFELAMVVIEVSSRANHPPTHLPTSPSVRQNHPFISDGLNHPPTHPPTYSTIINQQAHSNIDLVGLFGQLGPVARQLTKEVDAEVLRAKVGR